MKVPSCFFTVFSAAILSAAARNAYETEESWDILSAVFGTHLQSSIGHPKTLQHASASNYLSLAQSGFRVLCTTYAKGELISESVRSDPAIAQIQPLYIDVDTDNICFASNRPAVSTTHGDAFTIDFLVPAALKVHHSVYDIVTNLLTESVIASSNGHLNRTKSRYSRSLSPVIIPPTTPDPIPPTFPDQLLTPITPSIRIPDVLVPEVLVPEGGLIPEGLIPESDPGSIGPLNEGPPIGADDISVMFHDGTSAAEKQAVMNHFHETIHHLGTYDFSTLDEYFWTAPSTLDFFSRTIDSESQTSLKVTELLPYADRATHWSSLMVYLSEKVAADSLSGQVADPCLLNTHSVMEKEDQIDFPISHLSYDSDPKLAAACIAYVAASLSQEPLTRLVTLTNRPVVFNYRSRSVQQCSKAGSGTSNNPYSAVGLLGTNQVGAVADTGIDMTSCYFKDSNNAPVFSTISSPVYNNNMRKVIQYTYVPSYGDNTDEVAGHGTHTAGTMAGSINGADYATNVYDGVAPNAKIAFMDLSKAGAGLVGLSADKLFLPGYNAGARVHSNSWGSFFAGSGYYAAYDVDNFLMNHKELIVFYAAGNSGSDSSTSMESTSKNAVSVGSAQSTFDSTNVGYVSYFSSKGPTYDKRYKPDLVAPGDAIMSAKSNAALGATCLTTEKIGTSMAAPGAAGTALLIRQYFSDSGAYFWASNCDTKNVFCKKFLPSGVLMKAILLHSGTGMIRYDGGLCQCGKPTTYLNAPPDSTQGYGRVTLSNVLPLKGIYNFNLFVEDLTTIGSNSKVMYHAHVLNSGTPLKVTISWYDPPAPTGSTGKALINDLNLMVRGDDGVTWRGNGGNRAGGFDSLNNNEQVYIATPKMQRYQIVVSTNAIFTATQAFSIVVTCVGFADNKSDGVPVPLDDQDDYYYYKTKP